MSTKHPQTAMSVILWTPDCYKTLHRTVEALRRQTVQDQIELILIGPTSQAIEGAESNLNGFAGHQIVNMGSFTKSSMVRARGVQAARAPIVVFMQDHSFPVPGWAEALIKRYEEPWSGVGCVFANANPQNATSWCNFLVAYGDWADPPPPGPPRHIGGHNATYRRDALMSLGDELAQMLESSSTMQWELMKRGHRFTLEPAAKMYHENFSKFGSSVKLHFHLGRVFASKRTAKWSVPHRIVYALAWPLISFVRLTRLLRSDLRIGRVNQIPRLIPVAAFLLTCNSLGEAIGSLVGPGRSVEWITNIEFHRHRFMVGGERDCTCIFQ